MLLSGYPNANPTDPTYYLAQVVAALCGYELKIVADACGPSGIPASSPKFLPTVGEIKAYLALKGAAADKAAHYSTLLPQPRDEKKKPMWNLFIPTTVAGYDKIVEMSKERDPDHSKMFDEYPYYDGTLQKGIMVPYQWWDEVRGRQW